MVEQITEKDRRELRNCLEGAIHFLESYKENHWSAYLAESLELIEKYDFRGVERILSIFGGMGSFNDLYLAGINGHSVPDQEIETVNDNLQRIRGEIFSIVARLDRIVKRQE